MHLTPRQSERSYLSVDWTNPINWSHPLNRGLVSLWLNVPHWQGGTVLRDLAKRNNGTLTSMDPPNDWVGPQGRIGGWGALDFDGSNDRVDVGNPGSLNITGTYTLSAMIRPDTVTSDRGIVGKHDASIQGYFLQQVNADLRAFNNSSGAGAFVVASSVLAIGNWYHVASTWDGADLKIYVDGKEVASATSAGDDPATHSSNAFVGALLDAVWPFDGLIDDVRVHNVPWSPAEVAEYFRLSQQFYPGILNRWARRANSVPVAVGFIPYPNPRYAMRSGMQPMIGGLV